MGDGGDLVADAEGEQHLGGRRDQGDDAHDGSMVAAADALERVHGWNEVRRTLSTHSEGGLTDKDHALARRIDGLVSG